MEGIVCDRCGTNLLVDDDVRYVMKVEIFAAYDPMELTRQDLERDLEAEYRATVDSLSNCSEAELREQVWVAGEFDLCPACQRSVLADPLFKRRNDGEARREV